MQDPDLILAAADAFRRLAEAPGAGLAERQHWSALTDRARRAYEAANDLGEAITVPVNGAGRVIGQHHHRARLGDADVELILELRDTGLSYSQIAAKFDLETPPSRSTIAAICSGRRRVQTIAGHRLRPASDPVFWPAGIDEFEVCT